MTMRVSTSKMVWESVSSWQWRCWLKNLSEYFPLNKASSFLPHYSLGFQNPGSHILASGQGLVELISVTHNSLRRTQIIISGLRDKVTQPDHYTARLLFYFHKPYSGAHILKSITEPHAYVWVGIQGSLGIRGKMSMWKLQTQTKKMQTGIRNLGWSKKS